MISIIIRTIIIYIVVTLAIRLMGKRQIGDMQPNELVITLLISEIAAIPLQDTNQPILLGIVAIFILVFLEIIVSVLAMKSSALRKLMSGKSAVIIKNGIIDQQTMRNVRMTVLDLVELLRGKDVFNISDVAYAILEVNGDLSVLKKDEITEVSKKDLKIEPEDNHLPLPVITDGKIIKESIDCLQTTRETINEILKENNKTLNEIFLMTLDRDMKYDIVEKDKDI
ncbi:MAG: DUF421 domain-containing protein [Clostridia bacterium]|nr:DUF421 domain-containing protein [Clostridia bacterium]